MEATLEDAQGQLDLSGISPRRAECPALLVGDFNQNTWKGSAGAPFVEWQTESGHVELNDPALANTSLGRPPIDCCLLQVGTLSGSGSPG